MNGNETGTDTEFSVVASDALGFQLIGPGANRATPVDANEAIPSHPTNRIWTIRLRRGLYQYRLIGPLAANFQPTSRDTTTFTRSSCSLDNSR